jgi:hypothetical protein
VPDEVRDELTIHVVDMIDEVLKFALEPDVAAALETPQIWGTEVLGTDVRPNVK